MPFNPTLHTVRGFAAVLVFLYHWRGTFPALAKEYSSFSALGIDWNPFLWVKLGWIGVDWFFVLSGYVLAGTLWHKSLDLGTVLDFWKRRIVRIYPAVWLQMVTLLPFLYVTGIIAGIDLSQVALNALLWLKPFEGGARPFNAVLWTLVVEVNFYLLLPAFLILYRRTNIWLVLSVVLLLQLAGRFGPDLWPNLTPLATTLGFIHIHLPGLQLAFVAGMALNHFTPSGSCGNRQLGLLMGLLAYACMIWFAFHHLTDLHRTHWAPYVWRIGMVVVIAVILWSLLKPMRGTGWLGWRPLVWLGEISFGIYLWHFPIQRAMLKLFAGAWHSPAMSLVALLISGALTLALASLSYYLLERPLVRRFNGRRADKMRHTGGAMAAR